MGAEMELPLLATLLNNGTYNANQSRLKRSIFSEDIAGIYDLLKDAHEKYQHDIKPDDLYSLWLTHNPVATAAEINDFRDVVDTLKGADPLSDDIASDVIESLWRRQIGLDISNMGINMAEGDTSAMTRLKEFLASVSDNYMPDDYGEPTTDDIYELLAETSDENRWKFNIETLSRHVYGIGAAEFGIVFARPETGKSAFVVSLIAGPDGFCQQGAKVLYLGNEEKTTRTKLRAIQACSGMTRPEIAEHPDLAMSMYMSIRDRLVMKDTQEWDLDKIDGYCEIHKPDIIILDQADKVNISGSYNASHERIRELYRSLRELAKRHDCALLGVSQASADAEGRTRIDFSMLEGSKTGKAAEADLIIGIGKHNGNGEDQDPDHTRFLNISKNKLSGYHGCIICNIQPEISRYVE
jgi:replicative DNA helicase